MDPDDILDSVAAAAAAAFHLAQDGWGWLMALAGTELETTTVGIAALRLGAATLLGAIIGLEREQKLRPAGLRTHVLVTVASAMFGLMAIEFTAFPGHETEGFRLDPLRLIEAVTSGVAFLAAGTIIVARGRVKGLTTGAGMWLAGAIGLACGIGYFQLAAIGLAFAIVTLGFLRQVEAAIGTRSREDPGSAAPPAREARSGEAAEREGGRSAGGTDPPA